MRVVSSSSLRFSSFQSFSVIAILLCLFQSVVVVVVSSQQPTIQQDDSNKCERLQASLTYPQDKAPKDISAVLPLIVEKVNRELEGVVDVEVLFTGGDEHRKVGEHVVQCSVTRLAEVVVDNDGGGKNNNQKTTTTTNNNVVVVTDDVYGRKVITQCFHVPFTILDTNECTLPPSHPMRHKCHEPSQCINTSGSYECTCPLETEQQQQQQQQQRSPWELSYANSQKTSCPSSSSTEGCCDANGHSLEGADCRARFRCPLDPCQGGGGGDLNDCDSKASCVRAHSPLTKPSFTCQCPKGLMGNGHKCRKGIDPKPKPMVNYDGSTPTEETLQNNYCGCTKPVVDPCAGFPPCTGKHEICTISRDNQPTCGCKPGYHFLEGFGCRDETPPILKLRNDDPNDPGVTRLKQGDTYKEHAIDIIDENAEDYMRSLKITYSRPLPYGCLSQMGSFHVNYTVATPWTSPSFVRVTRQVIIEDIDECTLDRQKYETICPQLIPRCDTTSGAICQNTPGSYTCKCPNFTTGDGFLSILGVKTTSTTDHGKKYINAPVGYEGGNGCTDTSKPSIEILGPNPKIFRTCKCGGITGIMKKSSSNNRSSADQRNMVSDQRGGYENDIKEMIRETNGAELCATHTRRNPRPDHCVKAYDDTFRGRLDLTNSVKVGEPIQKSPFEWKVAYNVIDEAGNVADTVWRDIIVEEVDLADMESVIREEVLADRELEIQEAIRVALEKERRKQSNEPVVTRSRERKPDSCPKCPSCDCKRNKSGKIFTHDECQSLCNEQYGESCKNVNVKDYKNSRKNTESFRAVHPFIRDALDKLESIVSPTMAVILLILAALFGLILVIRIMSFALSQRSVNYYYSKEDEHREREMMNSVQYHRSPEPFIRSQNAPGSGPPRTSSTMLHGDDNVGGGGTVGNGIFSPQENRVFGVERGKMFDSEGSPIHHNNESIYRNMTPITPSHSNGSAADVARETRTKYSLRRRSTEAY